MVYFVWNRVYFILNRVYLILNMFSFIWNMVSAWTEAWCPHVVGAALIPPGCLSSNALGMKLTGEEKGSRGLYLIGSSYLYHQWVINEGLIGKRGWFALWFANIPIFQLETGTGGRTIQDCSRKRDSKSYRTAGSKGNQILETINPILMTRERRIRNNSWHRNARWLQWPGLFMAMWKSPIPEVWWQGWSSEGTIGICHCLEDKGLCRQILHLSAVQGKKRNKGVKGTGRFYSNFCQGK